VLSIIVIGEWVNIVLPLIISFSAILFFLYFIDFRFRKIPIRPLRIFQAYLEYHFLKNPESFEKMLENMSEEKDLDLSLFFLTSKNGAEISVFGLSAHFGPFGEIGSSVLPSRLINELEYRNNLKALLLRNLSNHNLDLISQKEVRKIFKKMIDAINFTKNLGECRASVVQKENEGYCVTVISIYSYCIVLLSCPGHSVEDFPPEWLPEFSSIVNRYGFIPMIIADAHNSIDSSSWKILDPDKGKFIKLLEEALECLKKSGQKIAEVGFYRIYPVTSSSGEIGPGGISTLVFNIDGNTHAIIVIDGNNMVKGLRNCLIGNLRNMLNLSTLEIVTTDTHLLTGIRGVEKGYFPVGSRIEWGLLLKVCLESVRNAIINASPCSASIWIGKVENVKVAGGLISMLENLVKYSDKLIRILIAMVTVLTASLLLLLRFF